MDQPRGFGRVAQVAHIAKTSDGVLVEAEKPVEDDTVELDHVELGLSRRNVCKGCGDGLRSGF